MNALSAMASITSYYVLKRDKHVLMCLNKPLCKSMSAIKKIDMKRKAKKHRHTDKITQRHETKRLSQPRQDDKMQNNFYF